MCHTCRVLLSDLYYETLDLLDGYVDTDDENIETLLQLLDRVYNHLNRSSEFTDE
jgi:hypothetical protein